MDLGELGRDAHLLGAAPGDRPDIAVRMPEARTVSFDAASICSKVQGISKPRILAELISRWLCSRSLKMRAAIDPLALENAAGVMQRMGQDMDIGVAPVDQLAVEPDDAVAIVEGLCRCCHASRSSCPRPDMPAIEARFTRLAEHVTTLQKYVNMADIKAVDTTPGVLAKTSCARGSNCCSTPIAISPPSPTRCWRATASAARITG